MGKIFNVSSSNCFVEILAEKLLNDYQNNILELSKVLILLPNRRAQRSLSDAFVKLNGMTPTLLPQMRAIGDVSEDEIMLSGQNVQNEFVNLPEVIDPKERTMLFMRLIMSRYKDFGLEKVSLSQACSLALELGGLIDTAQMYGLDWSNLKNLAPEEYAEHWQETLRFLEIITQYWPSILHERGVIDASERKNKLINIQCSIWQEQKPLQRIIIAGTTAVSPAMKNLVKTVLDLENGEVWLAGLDKELEEESFEIIDETHSQYELKQLLDFLEIKRNEIEDVVESVNRPREKLISEIMRPAISSDKWLELEGVLEKGTFDGIKVVECDDLRLESIAIGIMIRKALEEKEKTIALVTPDRNLARRVACELKRWNIEVDDSAGIPLSLTPWGVFMRLCVTAVLSDVSREKILALMKSKIFTMGKDKSETEDAVTCLDKLLWRNDEKNEQAEKLLADFYEKATKFVKLLKDEKALLKDILTEHILFAESLVCDNVLSGEENLWKGDDGQIGAGFMADWIAKADVLGEIETKEYLQLFETMMSYIMVRRTRNTHNRVRILGPMEARLNHYDEIILGSFNEGMWPSSPKADPWMSRPMKKDFGFESPEKQIGVLGLDFANLLGAKNVCITRAKTNNDTPTIKSRWLMRLETIIQALKFEQKYLYDNEIAKLAKLLDKESGYYKIEAPCPKPPVSARPRKMSASAFEKLLRDPYGVYAEYILKLKPLEALNKEKDMRDFGNLVHNVLEEFNKAYPSCLPENTADVLIKMVRKAFAKSDMQKEKLSFWVPKAEKMMAWVAKEEESYRHEVEKVNNEVWGSFCIDDLPGGKFEVYARADRIDKLIGGKVNIIDYKTGSARTKNEVKKGYAPQLPIEGLIAERGGFDGVEKAKVDSLMYWKLGDKKVCVAEDIDDILHKTEAHIREVVNLFDFETTGYLSRPNPKEVPEYSDYEHLARVKEWSVVDEESDND
ncbi:MAG: PD-(D/E)XK nuclease family protein [Alphaproteobacteria bacterium]|nr:PD-(D/E)XK nuclease family protein [Alphaproteobacteria bacterium]